MLDEKTNIVQGPERLPVHPPTLREDICQNVAKDVPDTKIYVLKKKTHSNTLFGALEKHLIFFKEKFKNMSIFQMYQNKKNNEHVSPVIGLKHCYMYQKCFLIVFI